MNDMVSGSLCIIKVVKLKGASSSSVRIIIVHPVRKNKSASNTTASVAVNAVGSNIEVAQG